MTTSARMLQLLSLLQARRDWPGAVLADRLEISERTVRRDVDRLREMGYRIHAVKGPDGGYRLEAGSELPPLLFDDEQAVVLAIALQTVSSAGVAFDEAAARALTTVRQVMPSRLRHRVDALRVTAVQDRGLPSTEPVDPALLAALAVAVRAAQTIRFDYDGSALPRHAEPHHLVARSGRWYVVAWDLDRDDWRTFRVDRLALKTPLGPHFSRREVPGGDVGAYLSGRFRGATAAEEGGGWGEWPCRGTVILEAPASSVAPYLDGADVEPLDGDRCRVRLGSWSWEGLAARAAGLPGAFTVESPPPLAAACRAVAARLAAAASAPAPAPSG